MSRLVRMAFVLGLGGAGVLTTPAPAAAQFYGGYGVGFPGNQFGPFGLPYRGPSFNYGWGVTAGIPNPLGGGTINYTRGYYGPVGVALWKNDYPNTYNNPNSFPAPNYSGYMTGGVRNPAAQAAPDVIAKAQRQATEQRMAAPTGVRTTIYDQWAYEKLGVAGLPGLQPGQPPPDALVKALAATDEKQVASGEVLNHIVVGIVASQGKGGKGDSAFLPPNLLAEVRFSGGPNADALNLLRNAGKLELPAAFEDGPLVGVRADLERDFAGVAGPVLAGKVPDPTRVARLEATVKKAHDLLTPAIKDLDFADATAARRFLNQLDSATKVLKTPAAAGLIDSKWATEGTTVADLVKHMTKFKLLFGPVEKGHEEAYLALHRGLAAYLFVLGQNAPPVKK